MKHIPMPILLDAASLQQILDILNIVWIALFAAVFVVLALLFLRGFFRGWKYGTYRLIFMGLLIAGALIALGPVSNLLGNFDVSGFGIPAIVVDMGEGKVINAPWTTPTATLTDFFNQLLTLNGVSSSGSEIFSYAFALALSVVKLVLLFVLALLISTLGYFLTWLFWVLIFRRIFVKKAQRKVKKLKLISAFEEVILGGVLMAMFIVPFTGVANALSNHAQLSKEEAEKNETAKMVYAVLDSYQNSLFSQVFFSWTKFDGKDSIDTRLASFFTKVDFNGVSTDFIHELSTFADIGSDLINDGVLSALGDKTFQWALILGTSMVPNLMDNLLATDLVKTALPVAMELALNLDGVKAALGEQTIEWLSNNSVEWTNELGNVASLYRNLLDADVFDCLIADTFSELPAFDFRNLYSLFDDPANQEAFHKALSYADSAVVNHLLAGLMYGLTGQDDQAKDDDPSTLQLIDFLPTDDGGKPNYDAMADISWFPELGIVYDTLYGMVNVDSNEMKDVFDELPSEFGGDKKSKFKADTSADASAAGEEFLTKGFTDKLVSFMVDHASDIVDILIGPRDANGHPTNVDPTTAISTGTKNFLDSALLYNALPSLVPYLGSLLDEAGLGSDLTEAETALLDSSEHNIRYNFKEEFGAMFDFIVNMTTTEEGKAFLKNISGLPGIEFDPSGKFHSIKPGLVDTLKSSLLKIDDSYILSSVVPQVADKFVTESIDLSAYLEIGLDFHCDNLGKELGKILDLVKKCPHVLRGFTNLEGLPVDSIVDLVVDEQDEFTALLETFVDSAIFNPVDPADHRANKNFCSLLNTVFSSISTDIDELTPEDLAGVKMVSDYDASGEIVSKGECARIVDVLTSIASTGVLDQLSSATSDNIGSLLKKLDIPATFNAIGASKIFSKLGGGLFDSYLSPILNAEELGLGEKVTFRNVKTEQQWQNEANAISAIVDIAASGSDFSNIDFFADATLVGPMLEALAKSGMFIYHDPATGSPEYVFPEYLYNKMLNFIDASSLKFFVDDGVTSSEISAATTLEAKRAITTSLYGDMVTSLPTRNDWVPESGTGEMAKINAFLADVGRLGGLDAFESFSADTMSGLHQMLHDVALSDAFGRTLLKNGLDETLGSIDTGGEFDFGAANTGYFAKAGVDADARSAEVDAMMDAIEAIYDPSYGMVSGGSFDSSRMNLTALSVDFFVKPTLEGMMNSKVLSTVPDGSDKVSIHDQVCCLLLRKAGLYSVSSDEVKVNPGHADVTIREIVAGVSDWDATTNALCELLRVLQSSSLVSGGEIDLSALSDPFTYFGGDSFTRDARAAELKTILSKINECELTFRALPEKLDDSLGSATDILGSSFDGSFIESSNPYFAAKAISGGYDLDPYPAGETDYIIDCLVDIARCQNIDSSDISSIDPDVITKLLNDMMHSGVFNSLKGGKTLTAYQGLLSKVVGLEALHDYLYLENPSGISSPKDLYYKAEGAYSSADAKATYLVKQLAATHYDGDLTAQEALMVGESGSLKSLLTLFVSDEMNDLISGGALSFDALTPNSLARILNELNSNAFFYDCVPNILAKLAGDASFAIDGVDLKLANYFHPYYYNPNGSHRAQPSYEARYSSDEIYNVASLFNLIKKTKDTLGGSFNLKSIDIVSLRNLLWDLNNSIVFHNEGRRDDCLEAESSSFVGDVLKFNDLTVFEQIIYLSYDKSQISSLTYGPATDLELYLQYGDKGAQLKKHNEIVSFAQDDWFDQVNDLCNLIAHVQSSPLVDHSGNISMSTDSIKELPPDDIMDFLDAINGDRLASEAIQISLRSLFGKDGSGIGLSEYTTHEFAEPQNGVNQYTSSLYGTATGHLSYSANAISLANFSGSASDLHVYADLDGDLNFETEVTSVAKMSNSGTDWTIDCSDIFYRVQVRSALTFDVTAVSYDAANYFYGQQAFEDSASSVLRTLLTSFYTSSNEYFNFQGSGEDLKNFRDEGLSTNGLLEFFRSYPAYETRLANDFRVSELGEFTAGELGFYNLMHIDATVGTISGSVDIGGNILNDPSASKAQRLIRLRELWTNPNYDATKEAVWFDAHVIDAGALSIYNAQAGALSSSMMKIAAKAALMTQSEPMLSLVTSLSDGGAHDDLFLAPEIVSGLLQGYVRSHLAWVNQDATYLSKTLSLNTASRIEMVRSSALPYGTGNYDYSITYANGDSALSTIIANTISAESAINGSDWTAAATAIAKLDNAAGPSISAADIIYLGSIYDELALASKFTSSYSGVTDLPSPKLDAANNYLNSLTPSVIASFYASVASIL